MSGYMTGIVAILCLNVILAYAVFLPVAAGQLNLGGAGFQAIGAYSAGYLSGAFDLGVAVTIPVAGVLGAVVAFLIAFPILRTKGVYLVLATMAFAEVAAGLIINVDALGGAMGMPVRAHIGLWPIVGAAIASVVLVWLFMSSRMGLAIRSVHDDETVAELLGVGVRATRVTAFTLGGFLAGIAGALYAHYFSFVEIQAFDSITSVYLLLFVLLGGTQTAWGPLVGAAFFTALPEIARNLLPKLGALIQGLFGQGGHAGEIDTSWRFIILGVITIIMMIVRPEGIVTRTLLEGITHRRGPGQRLEEV